MVVAGMATVEDAAGAAGLSPATSNQLQCLKAGQLRSMCSTMQAACDSRPLAGAAKAQCIHCIRMQWLKGCPNLLAANPRPEAAAAVDLETEGDDPDDAAAAEEQEALDVAAEAALAYAAATQVEGLAQDAAAHGSATGIAELLADVFGGAVEQMKTIADEAAQQEAAGEAVDLQATATAAAEQQEEVLACFSSGAWLLVMLAPLQEMLQEQLLLQQQELEELRLHFTSDTMAGDAAMFGLGLCAATPHTGQSAQQQQQQYGDDGLLNDDDL